ncbi:hypothetical protein SUGI_0592900 [Cryptomeria japonica]|uniref:uncharacterized protein LOC131057596 n=1 Tax=Cryptomeria japonica TaxID=3369 RepID=UPI00241495C1|nr:uncharacterized protein LOC131057596 [Cryptomeria japonica]GLJ29990.1 hypothetical protein SUGI_0592900 [Cryptomeria japonica]
MALQGAILATGTITTPLAAYRPTTSTNSKSKGTNVLQSANTYALSSAFVNGGASFSSLTDVRGPPRYTLKVSCSQAYICRDCGYIYNDRKPFEKVADNYFCPVCGAPKRRFRPYAQPVARNVNDTSTRKARKEELKREGDANTTLVLVSGLGVGAFVATYLYLNSQLF